MTERHDKKPVGIATLLRLGRRRAESARRQDLLLPPPSTSGVYVDIENLKNAEHARAVIETVVRDWPEGLPPVGRLYLYAPADKTGLWGAWAPARFPDLEVRVRGVQRFARESKNSADMAIVGDAVADFTCGAASHIAVVSNDSDFDALFVKIQELASRSGHEDQPPFLWVNLAGGSGLSKEIREFIPEQLRWVATPPPGPSARTATKPAQNNGASPPTNQTIVRWLLDEIPSGRFRARTSRRSSSDAAPTIPPLIPPACAARFSPGS